MCKIATEALFSLSIVSGHRRNFCQEWQVTQECLLHCSKPVSRADNHTDLILSSDEAKQTTANRATCWAYKAYCLVPSHGSTEWKHQTFDITLGALAGSAQHTVFYHQSWTDPQLVYQICICPNNFTFMTLTGHSHPNNARDKILVDFVHLQKISLTVELDRKITSMSGQELVRVIYNPGICFKNREKPYEFSSRTNGNEADIPSKCRTLISEH